MLRRALLFIAIGAVAGLIIWWPAAWVSRFLPPTLRCDAPQGTIWSGECASLLVKGAPVGRVAWRMQPRDLFVGRLSLSLDWRATANGHGHAKLAASLFDRRTLALRDVELDTRIDALRAAMPSAPWSAGIDARVNAQWSRLELSEGLPTSLEGHMTIGDLRGASPQWQLPSELRLESSATVVSADGLPMIRIVDRGDGGLRIRGSLTFVRPRGHQLELVLTPSDDPALRSAIAALGPRETDGSVRYSLAATW